MLRGTALQLKNKLEEKKNKNKQQKKNGVNVTNSILLWGISYRNVVLSPFLWTRHT